MKYAIIVLAVVVVMHDISIHRLNRKFEILKSFFDTVVRTLENYVSEQTEKEFTAYDSAKTSHNCIGIVENPIKAATRNRKDDIKDI